MMGRSVGERMGGGEGRRVPCDDIAFSSAARFCDPSFPAEACSRVSAWRPQHDLYVDRSCEACYDELSSLPLCLLTGSGARNTMRSC